MGKTDCNGLIESTSLSSRTKSALEKAGIFKIQDVLSLSMRELANYQSLGISVLRELETFKKHYDNSDDSCLREAGSEEETPGVEIPIEELELSARAYNALRLNNILYLSGILLKSAEELACLEYFTPSLAEEVAFSIREYLRSQRNGAVGHGTVSVPKKISTIKGQESTDAVIGQGKEDLPKLHNSKADATIASEHVSSTSEATELDNAPLRVENSPVKTIQTSLAPINNEPLRQVSKEVGGDIKPASSNRQPEYAELDGSSTPIEELGLSMRAYNCLKRNRINIIQELSGKTIDELCQIRNLGRKSAEEIYKAISLYKRKQTSLENGEDGVSVTTSEDAEDLNKEDVLSVVQSQIEDVELTQRVRTFPLSIESLNLTVRAYNCLKRAKISTIQQILNMTCEELIHVKNLGQKSYDETIAAVVKAVREVPVDVESGNITPQSAIYNDEELLEEKEPLVEYASDDRPIELLNFGARTYNCLKRAKIKTVQQLLDTDQDDLLRVKNLGRKSLLEIELFKKTYAPPESLSLSDSFTSDNLMPRVLAAFQIPFKGLSFQEIKQALPEAVEESLIKQTIGKLIASSELEYVDFRCYKTYPSFYTFYDSFLQSLGEREYEVFSRRYAGETLEAIAQDQGITRERIRQIEKKLNRKLREIYSKNTGYSVFDEDYYETLFTKCDLPDSFWAEELGLPQPSIRYLKNSYSHGTAKPDEVLSDEDVPIGLRYRLKSFLDRDKVRIDGILFARKRSEIEEYALRKYAQNELPFEQFVKLYNGLLESNGIPFDEKLYYTEDNLRSRTNRFGDSLYCLWKQGERMRFYDIQARDYAEMLDALCLESYQNTEVSTRKFMALHPDLMEKYDIRDPYELHNLLKKIAGQYGLDGVQFSRQPMLQFGTFDRDKAIWDALVLLSPVTQADLCDYLYQEYGYEKLTTAINYLKPLSQYCHNGVYSVDYQHIPEWRIEPLQNALTADFYYVDEIKEVYISLFRDADENDINPRSLKSLGFLVNNTYVIQGYSSADAFFRNLLTRDDVYSAREYISRFGSIQMFNQVYAELLHTHVIFKYEQDQIITLRRLERFGISAEIIEDYCAAVQDYLDADCYFTIESLRQDGFTHQLDSLGFSDFFYASLLGVDKRFSVQRAFGTPVLYNGMVSGQFSVADFIVSQLRDYDSVDLDEFIQDIQDRFGIKIPERYEVTYAIKGTELYYDDIMDKVYLDKALYYADFDE